MHSEVRACLGRIKVSGRSGRSRRAPNPFPEEGNSDHGHPARGESRVTTGAADFLKGGDDVPGLEPVEGAELSITARSPLDLFWRRFRRDRVAVVALAFIIMIVVVAIFAPLIINLVNAPAPSATDRSTLDDFGLPSTALNGGPFNSHHLFGV